MPITLYEASLSSSFISIQYKDVTHLKREKQLKIHLEPSFPPVDVMQCTEVPENSEVKAPY